MYWLMSIDAVVRIAAALAILFVAVPLLAWPRRREATFLEWFFWNLGIGITLLTLTGQLFTLARLFSLPTLLLAAAALILFARASRRRTSAWTLLRESAERSFLALLNVFDGRVNVRRRIRRRYRRAAAALRARTAPNSVRLQIAGWTALVIVAAALRLYRPFVTANLGFSDTYVHLYLLKLLEEGRQVDPAWGPYPRGMHFLLMAIHHLTNVGHNLLMNFFGAFAGLLMTLGVADVARRLTRSTGAGLAAGFLFGTTIGGASQYFVLGGRFATGDPRFARQLMSLPYEAVPRTTGEFDLALLAFQRQTSTLSQELALALLFPAAMFLLDFFRTRDRWHLLGFAGCTAAIASVHSGVVVPLVLMAMVALLALAFEKRLTGDLLRRASVAATAAVFLGSTWMLGYIAYPYAGGKRLLSADSTAGDTALYYFPVLRSLAGRGGIDDQAHVPLTPFAVAAAIVAIALLARALSHRDERRGNLIWISSVSLLFLAIHYAATIGLPPIVEITRNSQWLLMALPVLLSAGGVEAAWLFQRLPRYRLAAASAALAILFVGWSSRIPRLSEPAIRDRIINYSGYGASALAVLRIERSLEPFTWTIISYGQEFPMVLQRGFHLPAADFLDRYDPTLDVIPIPTRHIFVIVEKTPHPFEIGTWTRRFRRADLQQRLQTWIHLYQTTHRNMRLYLEDDQVRVYQIERTPGDLARAARQARQ